MADLRFPIRHTEHVAIVTDGTCPGTIVELVGIDGARVSLACVAAFEGNGERLDVPGFDPADPEIITLKVRGTVSRRPPVEPTAPADPMVAELLKIVDEHVRVVDFPRGLREALERFARSLLASGPLFRPDAPVEPLSPEERERARFPLASPDPS
jgi:hypothetical protein